MPIQAIIKAWVQLLQIVKFARYKRYKIGSNATYFTHTNHCKIAPLSTKTWLSIHLNGRKASARSRARANLNATTSAPHSNCLSCRGERTASMCTCTDLCALSYSQILFLFCYEGPMILFLVCRVQTCWRCYNMDSLFLCVSLSFSFKHFHHLCKIFLLLHFTFACDLIPFHSI